MENQFTIRSIFLRSSIFHGQDAKAGGRLQRRLITHIKTMDLDILRRLAVSVSDVDWDAARRLTQLVFGRCLAPTVLDQDC